MIAIREVLFSHARAGFSRVARGTDDAARRRVRFTVVPILVALGCGGSSKSAREAAEPPPTEHWETLSDRRYVYRGGCTIGPFEIELPAREELEYGRRVAILVYGPRRVRFDKRIESERFQTIGSLFLDEDDHSRCRVGDGDTAMPATAPPPGKPVRPGKPGKPGKPGRPVAPEPPPRADDAVAFITLDEYTGELPAGYLQVNAQGYLPHGNPWFYADEYRTMYSTGRYGMASFRLRFWSDRPQDMDGVIIRVLDQKLVPDLPLAEWRAQYAKRVADADAKREARRPEIRKEWDEYVARCTAQPKSAGCEEFGRSRGRMPPPPRAETPPPSPGPNVAWVPGYWSLDETLDDFVWIPGTYVVRAVKSPPPVAIVEPELPAPKRVEPEPASPSPPPAPPAVVVEPEPTRRIEARVEAPPPPRVEVLPPPPNVVGVVWVPGAWQLVGARWQWAPGRWVLPPRDHAYRVPTIQTRGRVRFYVPGGWIRRRR